MSDGVDLPPPNQPIHKKVERYGKGGRYLPAVCGNFDHTKNGGGGLRPPSCHTKLDMKLSTSLAPT
jgi:hypothetical protein